MANKSTPRPYIGIVYLKMAVRIAAEINKTNMEKWKPLDAIRYGIELLHQRIFPDTPLPPECFNLRRRYYKDVEI